jgi:hypothetical protein
VGSAGLVVVVVDLREGIARVNTVKGVVRIAEGQR